jgi:hypothetical protein
MKKNKIIMLSTAAVVLALVTYRAVQISIENSRTVFNIARAHAQHGTPVETRIARTQTGHLLEPIAVAGNRIYVSGARVHRFKVGQRLAGGGRITSVSNRIDLDTGLFIVRTSGATDGSHFVLAEHTGIFLPLHAVSNSSVMIVENGAARARDVVVIASDAETVVVRGLLDGDVAILTQVAPGTKIKGY